MFSTRPIDGGEYLGRNSMTVSSLMACCIATPNARIPSSPTMRKITFFRRHARKCSTTAETTFVAGHFSSTLIAAIIPRAMSSTSKMLKNSLPGAFLRKTEVGHDDRELKFFVGLYVMRIGCGSGSYAVAAPVSETRVCEPLRGLLRHIRTDGNALASGLSS